MNNKEPSFEIDASPNGSIELRINAWDRASEKALSSLNFDWLRLSTKNSLESYKPLIPYAHRIKNLWCPDVNISTDGLEQLTFIEKIHYGQAYSRKHIDYRKLPNLKYFQSGTASEVKPEYLNHPNIEEINLYGFKIKDFSAFSESKNLKKLTLTTGPLKNFNGIEHLNNLRQIHLFHIKTLNDISALSNALKLEVIEFDHTPNISDISSVKNLINLRWLAIDGRKAKQSDINWISNLSNLECVSLFVETEKIDWRVFANHQRLYNARFYTTAGFVSENDKSIISVLSAKGKKVTDFTRYPKSRFPGFSIDFAPPKEVKNPIAPHTYLLDLRYQPGTILPMQVKPFKNG